MVAQDNQPPMKEPLKTRCVRSAMPAASQLPGWKGPTDVDDAPAHAPDDDEAGPSHFMT